ncbi:hypothetical protein AU082_19795, partial [Yersinia pestis]
CEQVASPVFFFFFFHKNEWLCWLNRFFRNIANVHYSPLTFTLLEGLTSMVSENSHASQAE